MNGKGARQDAPETVKQLRRFEVTTELGEYHGERAMRCPDCDHVSPSALHLRRHIEEKCCGGWMRWAA